jgi:hypothetical protein
MLTLPSAHLPNSHFADSALKSIYIQPSYTARASYAHQSTTRDKRQDKRQKASVNSYFLARVTISDDTDDEYKFELCRAEGFV